MTKLDQTHKRISELARHERGRRSRDTIIAGVGLSRSVLQDFEGGKTWPHDATLRKVELALGWPEGIIDNVCKAGIDPERLVLGHMRGELPLISDVAGLGKYTTTELMNELAIRAALDAQGSNAARELFERLESQAARRDQ